jgi:Tfp pilus assembly protein PilX
MIDAKNPGVPSGRPARQTGAVLIIALVVLVAMTLSALSLMRSVNTTHLIAGNLAFRESAVLSAEGATENALSWLVGAQAAGLYTDKVSNGYLASRADPNWETYWDTSSSPQVRGVRDVAGNRVDYVIHRLCEAPGAPLSDATRCAKPPISTSTESRDGGKEPFWTGHQVYYRITSRVTGPRNTVVYTQTVVAL